MIIDHADVVGAAPVQLHRHCDLTSTFNGLDKDNCKSVYSAIEY